MYKYFVSFFIHVAGHNTFGSGCGIYELENPLNSMKSIETLKQNIEEDLLEKTGFEGRVTILNFQRIED
jgi:hypothetical protein